MFILINVGKLRLKQQDPENFGDQFMYWEDLIDSSDGPFIEGDKPGSKDMICLG